jgi:hypothetical protein
VGDATSTGPGPTFNEEPGDRGPMSLLEILAAHKAIKMAAAGLVERPRGVSRREWALACDFAHDVTPALCWVLGHLGGHGGRLLDMLVRAAGPIGGGLPDGMAEGVPLVYLAVMAPPGACHLCGFNHKPGLPHDVSPLFQMQHFARHGRRATLEDACSHCPEPVQALFAKFWTRVGCWPHVPDGFQPPPWFAAAAREMFAQCVRHLP